MPLTDVQIKRLEPRSDRYAVSDGRMLALQVMPTGLQAGDTDTSSEATLKRFRSASTRC